MFLKQKGFLPLTLFIIGVTIHIVGILFTAPYLLIEIYQSFYSMPSTRALVNTLELIAFWVGTVWSIPLLIGSFFISVFPEIRLIEKGIEYRTYKIIRSVLLWEEIEDVIDLPKGYKAILLKRKGFSLTNGLYSNQIYGDIIKVKCPVLLLSPKTEDIETVIRTISLQKKKNQ